MFDSLKLLVYTKLHSQNWFRLSLDKTHNINRGTFEWVWDTMSNILLLCKPRSVYRRALLPWGVYFDIKIKTKKIIVLRKTLRLLSTKRRKKKTFSISTNNSSNFKLFYFLIFFKWSEWRTRPRFKFRNKWHWCNRINKQQQMLSKEVIFFEFVYTSNCETTTNTKRMFNSSIWSRRKKN